MKNQGLDSIEVQDNGSGISPANYDSLALKHYTSKLSTYSDLTTLETFGFRGEALSSLCALSRFTVTTCLQADVPKGTKLDFDTSGKLKGTSIVAAQKGTTVTVENLFQTLPVRRRELERNIKREWAKVITLLNQYACVQTRVKFTVSQQPNKGKRIVLFATKGNKTTRENIINVFGAKTMTALVPLDLKLQLEPTGGPSQRWGGTQGRDRTQDVLILGFVSRPVHGEGRQTPDRQLFYVNSRPCGLPQFAKVFNEVYRSFNSTQSPFVFADIQLDTHLYDVNVSPDKRTILLHDQSRMLSNLREALIELFEKQEYTVPISQITPLKQTPFKKPTILRQQNTDPESSPTVAPPDSSTHPRNDNEEPPAAQATGNETSGMERIRNLAAAKALAREAQASSPTAPRAESTVDPQVEAEATAEGNPSPASQTHVASNTKQQIISAHEEPDVVKENMNSDEAGSQEDDFLARLAKMKRSFLPASLQDEIMEDADPIEPPIPALAKPSKPSENAPLGAPTPRPSQRPSQEVATITIGDHTVTSIIGTPAKRPRTDEAAADRRGSHKKHPEPRKAVAAAAALPSFRGRLTQMFAAASARQQQSVDEEDEGLDTDDAHSGEGSENGSDVAPGSERELTEEANTASEGEDDYEDDAKSSPLFVEEDDDNDEPNPSPVPFRDRRTREDPEEMDDEEYLDGAEDENMEEIKTESIVKGTQEANDDPGEENQKRTRAFLKGGAKGKYSTQSLLQRARVDHDLLERRLQQWKHHLDRFASRSVVQDGSGTAAQPGGGLEAENAEEKLSLAIHKGDFGKMKIVGQFNLGFILAVRPASTNNNNNNTLSSSSDPTTAASSTQINDDNNDDDDQLFIIDQHASDEKFNFERLQASTVVQSQRLVRPKPLELTAVEEEVVLENQAALEKNGFVVAVDTSGAEPVGARCQLLSLPLSRETTFSLADLEELISLLGDNPTTTSSNDLDGDNHHHGGDGLDDGVDDGGGLESSNRLSSSSSSSSTATKRYVPRPSKVRKMFAMRACRCSIMIGKALSQRQMETVVRHMGGMEKPWNCPHGRPTMRHLCGLGAAWDPPRGWREEGQGGGGDDGDDDDDGFFNTRTTDWAGYVKQKKANQL